MHATWHTSPGKTPRVNSVCRIRLSNSQSPEELVKLYTAGTVTRCASAPHQRKQEQPLQLLGLGGLIKRGAWRLRRLATLCSCRS